MKTARIPTDLSAVKSKFLFGLTKRQMICFGSGALIGVPLFFMTKDQLTVNGATAVMMVVMMPFFAFGLFEKNGQPLEVVLKHMVESRFLRPSKRPYRTENVYVLLEEQADLRKKVRAIVRKAKERG